MERIQSINPARIAWCCADRGIAPSDLASGVGISESTIERLMGGEGITYSQLRKIADYFGRGVLFFLENGPVDEGRVHSTEFRTLANQEPEMSVELRTFIERVERQREIFLSLREDLDQSDFPSFEPPEIFGRNPRDAADIARNWLGLKDVNDFNSYREAIEAKGILVFQSNGYNGKWKIPKIDVILGFTLYDSQCPIIVVKKQPWETQQVFTLFHELGHLLLHRSTLIDDETDMFSQKGHEKDANAFAGLLLIPDDFLSKIVDAERPREFSEYDKWLKAQRNQWGVSNEVIVRRLTDAGRFPRSLYGQYREWLAQLPVVEKEGGNRSYRYREPLHIFGNTFVRTVFSSLYTRNITLARASTFLDNLKIKDLHKLETACARL